MESMIADIKFKCSHCGLKMVVDGSAAGLDTECPQCNGTVVIPRRASLHDAALMPGRQVATNGATALRDGREADATEPEVSALRQELTDASVQISRLEGELADVEKLKKEKRRLRTDLTQVKKDLTAKEAELAEAMERAQALAGELNRMEGELTVEQEQGIRLRMEVEAYVTERTEILPRLEAAEAGVEALSQSLREREAELQDLRTNLTDTQAARTTALREIQGLETQLAELNAELTSTRAMSAQTEAKLATTTDELALTKKRLADSEEAARALGITVRELEKERDVLSKSLSQDTAGKDLVTAREQLGTTTKERDRLGLEVERLNTQVDSARERQRQLETDLKSALRELDEARRRAEAASEHRLRQDNEVLRGIIARQNSELEQRHALIVRLKRAQLGVRLAYAAFGIGLLLIAMWAMKAVPGLKLGRLF